MWAPHQSTLPTLHLYSFQEQVPGTYPLPALEGWGSLWGFIGSPHLLGATSVTWEAFRGSEPPASCLLSALRGCRSRIPRGLRGGAETPAESL